jgi:catecholate siderophore receptor
VFIALACVGFIASAPGIAQSGAAPADDKEGAELQGVTVTDTAIEDTIKVARVQSPKATRPILDTPQTITVIGNQTLRQQNLLTLKEALTTIPGITFTAGEGGFGSSDNINLRGYSAANDITTDGVRNSAAFNRNETFHIEQIEVYNGANSVFNGAGSVGGTINIVTKVPRNEDFVEVGGGVGTDDYYRGTVDANLKVNDKIAFRLNAVGHRNDIPGRQVEDSRRWGVLPSVAIGLDGPTRLTFSYLFIHDKGYPQYGVPFLAGGLPEGINREAYYGFRNVDAQDSKQHQLTGIFSHDFSDNVSIRDLVRYEAVNQYTVTSQPAGAFCLPSTGRLINGTPCTQDLGGGTTGLPTRVLTVPAGYYRPTGGRGTARRIRNETAYSQIDLSAKFATAGLEHTLVLGGSALWEQYNLAQGSVLRNADGTDPFAINSANGYAYYPLTNIANPNEVVPGPATGSVVPLVYGSNVYTGPQNFILGSRNRGEQTSYAVYLFDAVKVTDWFELNGGARYEKVNGTTRTRTYGTTPGATFGQQTATSLFGNEDELFSFRAGAVVKPTRNTSVYAAYGNARTPSKANVNGSCAVDTCNVTPEKARSYEVGIKAEIFDGGLLLNAALFRNERNGYRVQSGDPTIPDQVLNGRSRVDGVALGATGQITKEWSIFANYTYLDSEVLQSVSDFCLANPGFHPPGAAAATCTNTPADPDPGRGLLIPQTPKHSGSLFTTYTLPFGLQLGYGFTYQGSFQLNATSRSDDFLTHRAFLAYTVNDRLSAQINVQNFTNEKYFTNIRANSSWALPGTTRQGVLTVTYRM